MADRAQPSPSDTPPDFDDWRSAVEANLKDRGLEDLVSPTRNGFAIQPLYPRRTDTEPLPGRNAHAWAIVQPVDDPAPDRANAQALADISGGATGLSLRFAGSLSAGSHGLPPNAEAMGAAIEGIDLARVHLRLDPNPLALRIAGPVQKILLASRLAPERMSVAFGLDPVAAIQGGEGTANAAAFAAAFSTLRAAYFKGPLAVLDARPFHEAGASEVQELGAGLAIGAWWLRALDGTGVPPAEAFPFFGASLSVDRDLLLSLAKLRALQLLWARFQQVCGAPATRLPVHAETSRRMLTRVDPHSNLLRNTLAAFAAAIAGADSILVEPHTAALALPDANARALARNIQHLLLQEADISAVSDPGAGSGAIEALTGSLAERGWAEFQQIEREGGIVESITSGALPARIAEACASLVREVKSGTAPLVGSTVYPAAEPPDAGEPKSGPSGLLSPMRLEAQAKAAA